MKRIGEWLIIIVPILLAGAAQGATSVKVYEADGTTPFSPRLIMEGTKLVIKVESDQSAYWGGGLFMAEQNRGLGLLTGRGYDPNTDDWAESHTAAAGPMAICSDYRDSSIWGFDLHSDSNSLAGEWFVLDYEAIGAGEPNVAFYDYSQSWMDPNQYLYFSQAPTRDFNLDGTVNLKDFQILAGNWQRNDCNDPNDPNACDGTDINEDGLVNSNDLIMFSYFWLWPTSDPNRDEDTDPNLPPDPDVTYRVVDGSLLDEITMDIGTTITLYVNMLSEPNTSVTGFQLETILSDPNLGSIDNRAYDPNDPPGPGTARLLATPRWEAFDYWGPGEVQEEGIRYMAVAALSSSFADGHQSSFDYTANVVGDITLSITNVQGVYADTESILIHQVDPNSQQQMSSGGGGGSSLLQSSQSISEESLSIEEIIQAMDEFYRTDETMKSTYDQEEWDQFISTLRLIYLYRGEPIPEKEWNSLSEVTP
jgi:hypothetical protein